ncbi:hypothetical protein FRACA_140037 [Frankia canadensis]|uniref:Uncharacterized protein n=1 Tax=Frankia canadensis TaxID=1836972 RepID=A0A2I2KL89_9ACTN|nr:hypothetical protein FRACA_140037 [Frankia canadensis]SOU53728.1 hypothetical protein FRACA_140037 [Frankia canadensis]
MVRPNLIGTVRWHDLIRRTAASAAPRGHADPNSYYLSTVGLRTVDADTIPRPPGP